jgi:hypothetical protein
MDIAQEQSDAQYFFLQEDWNNNSKSLGSLEQLIVNTSTAAMLYWILAIRL